MSGLGWIGVDLDRTLARHEHGALDRVGPPIPAMLDRVRAWLAEGREVRIVTARAHSPSGGLDLDQVDMIESWCDEHLGRRLRVTCSKDYDMAELWDDRAVQVVPNEGLRADEVQHAIGKLVGHAEVRAHDRQPGNSEADDLRAEATSDGEIVIYGGGDVLIYTDAREARCLAARLLRAADQVETR